MSLTQYKRPAVRSCMVNRKRVKLNVRCWSGQQKRATCIATLIAPKRVEKRCCSFFYPPSHLSCSKSGCSLRGRRLKGKGKGVLVTCVQTSPISFVPRATKEIGDVFTQVRVLGARETRGAREEGRRETPARFLRFLYGIHRFRTIKSWRHLFQLERRIEESS